MGDLIFLKRFVQASHSVIGLTEKLVRKDVVGNLRKNRLELLGGPREAFRLEQSASERDASGRVLWVLLQPLLTDLDRVVEKPCLAVLLGELDEHPRVRVRVESFFEFFDTAH